MAGVEEHPSKRRKLELSDDLEDSEKNSFAHDPQEKSGMESANGHQNPEVEENELSHIEVPEATKEDPPLSKNQLKKRRRDEAWQAAKLSRKDQRRDKRKAKQARKAEARAVLEEKTAKGEIEEPKISPEEMKKLHQRPVQVPVTLIMDCDFNELMTEKELISLGAQLTRCYSDNRHSKHRAHVIISSWNGALRTRFETVLTNHHQGWKGVRFLEKDFMGAAAEMDTVMRGHNGGKLVGALAPLVGEKAPLDTNGSDPRKEGEPEILSTEQEETTASAATEPAPPSEPSIVYLTSDSPHTLERLSPNTSYIIGGIVDKNRHKGLCYKRACEKGISTAKLPIGEYMTMQSRSVLAVNHVVEIMLKWLETGDWGEAFLSVIPKRKEAQLKTKKGLGQDARKEEESVEEDDGPIIEVDSAAIEEEEGAID